MRARARARARVCARMRGGGAVAKEIFCKDSGRQAQHRENKECVKCLEQVRQRSTRTKEKKVKNRRYIFNSKTTKYGVGEFYPFQDMLFHFFTP